MAIWQSIYDAANEATDSVSGWWDENVSEVYESWFGEPATNEDQTNAIPGAQGSASQNSSGSSSQLLKVAPVVIGALSLLVAVVK
ncbi:hypothetical protein [Gynuella sunshinyii]|uniref:Uncharacterized protein n=1 Tax=Gynuella sunshinyii YC6258 TaxID=1445510 RepID=A0A0C5VFV8_9GAMM|nr:hypothetical protein [Gynuella sunshinyii]AJQ92243.1 hypothetical Protein YC6258_00191 [Gynuella sunshinyii YC6258]AJQ95810.1 hypothetical Protein YC6258_03774 [Gynuella sunshinyii YC6258]